MNVLFAILSIIFLHVIYVYTNKHISHTLALLFASMIYTFGYAIFFVSNYFTGTGVTSGVWYHLMHGQIEEANIFGAYKKLIITSCLVLIAYILLLITTFVIKKRRLSQVFIPAWVLYGYIIFIAIVHPLLHNIISLSSTPSIDATYISTSVAPLLDINTTTDALRFEAYMPQSPVTINSTSTQKNVLLIYLEGLEQTFSDKSIFSDLTPNLQTLSAQHTIFTNIHQIEPASFTIGGIVASQCGLPLFSSTSNESHEGMKSSFLGGATCLGDILKTYGYTNTYIGGAESSFAGKKTFFLSHGYDTIIGKDEMVTRYNLSDNQLHNWGVYDDVLFETYYNTFLELSKSETPFMLTALTLDTHPPVGYVSKECKNANLPKQANTMLDAIACTDYLVGRLVQQVKDSPYYSNTTIIIVSDHLAMRSAATEVIDDELRTNRILIIDNSTAPASYDTYGTTLDTGTTILPYIGFHGRIGLGRDLRNDIYTPIRRAVNELYDSWFFDVIALWDPPIFTNPISINVKQQEVQIETQTFAFPSFINFTPSWESAITFRYAQPENTLLDYPSQMEPYKTYLLIEECRLLDPDTIYNVPYCIGYGTNNIIVTVEPMLDNTITITKEAFISKATLE